MGAVSSWHVLSLYCLEQCSVPVSLMLMDFLKFVSVPLKCSQTFSRLNPVSTHVNLLNDFNHPNLYFLINWTSWTKFDAHFPWFSKAWWWIFFSSFHPGRKSNPFSLPWSQSFALNRLWGPSSPTSPWSVRLASSTWLTSWKGELPLFVSPPPHPIGLQCTVQGYLVSLTNLISVLSLQHPALRGHCVHVPVPRRRQVHVPLPSSEKGGHEQQWGKEWDLGGAVCNMNRGI